MNQRSALQDISEFTGENPVRVSILLHRCDDSRFADYLRRDLPISIMNSIIFVRKIYIVFWQNVYQPWQHPEMS